MLVYEGIIMARQLNKITSHIHTVTGAKYNHGDTEDSVILR